MHPHSTELLPENTTAATNLVRRPADGVVITSSGRPIPQPPWIIPDDPQSYANYDQWLIDQSRHEALDLKEDFILAKLDSLPAGDLDVATRRLLSDFLFGLTDPKFEARPIGETATGDDTL